MSKTATKNSITLKGSAAIIKEYLSKLKIRVFSTLFSNCLFPANFQILESIRFSFNAVFTRQRLSTQFNNMD